VLSQGQTELDQLMVFSMSHSDGIQVRVSVNELRYLCCHKVLESGMIH
jgi:hypothetical protein